MPVDRALRPDEHGALRVRPGDVRQDRGRVPGELRARGGRPAPARRLAAAMMAPAPAPPTCTYRGPRRAGRRARLIPLSLILRYI